ncbi:UNVERIFIED_CONTAM: hypothetical protein Sradi_6854700 [Sesamum radiatum]|uniref:DUF4283 domain-containing protein n=1 Tax=Sesamum radiatum TaxID=300843 RepID=A0AAW2JKR1_SESRA
MPRFPSRVTFLPRRSVTPVAEGVTSDAQDSGEVEPELVRNPQEPERDSEHQDSQDGPRVLDAQCALPELVIGKVKINMARVDGIADAFLNSTRKHLRYVPPMKQREEIIIKPSASMVEQGAKRWQSTAVGYFLGRRPYFPHLEGFARSNWKGLQHVSATANGFYFFQFKTVAFMEEVIEDGPWLFQGQPVVLQPWEQGLSLRRQKHLQVPVWIRIRHLPMEYWTEDGLSAVASGVGVPLYADKITKLCLRLDYARVCVMLDYHSTLPKHLVILSPNLREGHEVPLKVDIEYEWLPQRCTLCCSLGHKVANCPDGAAAAISPCICVCAEEDVNNRAKR